MSKLDLSSLNPDHLFTVEFRDKSEPNYHTVGTNQRLSQIFSGLLLTTIVCPGFTVRITDLTSPGGLILDL